MPTCDYYAEAKLIATMLESRGYASEAQTIQTALSTGTFGTEIIMALRFYLAPLVNAARLEETERFRIRMLHDALDHELAATQG